MARAEPIDHPTPWRQRLAKPVHRIHRAALVVLIVLVAAIVLLTGWLVVGIASGSLQLALWQQVLIVIGLIGLIGMAGLAVRVAFFTRIVRGLLR